MEYTALGRTGLKVSVAGLGCVGSRNRGHPLGSKTRQSRTDLTNLHPI